MFYDHYATPINIFPLQSLIIFPWPNADKVQLVLVSLSQGKQKQEAGTGRQGGVMSDQAGQGQGRQLQHWSQTLQTRNIAAVSSELCCRVERRNSISVQHGVSDAGV